MNCTLTKICRKAIVKNPQGLFSNLIKNAIVYKVRYALQMGKNKNQH